MFQLVFFFLLTSLVSFSLVSTALPTSAETIREDAVDASAILHKELPVIQRSYQHLVATQAGLAPNTTQDADGGFAVVFAPLLKLLPATPPGFQWSYHRYPDDASPWAGMNYVCLRGEGATARASFKGLVNATADFHPGRYFVAEQCGATSSYGAGDVQQRYAVTYFLVYTPPEPEPEAEVEQPELAPESSSPETAPVPEQAGDIEAAEPVGREHASETAKERAGPWAEWKCKGPAKHCRDK